VTISQGESGNNILTKEAAMCDGEGLGLIQMAMTPIGLAVTAAVAGALLVFARWVMAD
jgi:hypothetical protein